jgi:hypothetical protein
MGARTVLPNIRNGSLRLVRKGQKVMQVKRHSDFLISLHCRARREPVAPGGVRGNLYK